jgi:hypothetical protein
MGKLPFDKELFLSIVPLLPDSQKSRASQASKNQPVILFGQQAKLINLDNVVAWPGEWRPGPKGR